MMFCCSFAVSKELSKPTENFMILLFLFSLYFLINALFHITSTSDPIGSLSRTLQTLLNRKCTSTIKGGLFGPPSIIYFGSTRCSSTAFLNDSMTGDVTQQGADKAAALEYMAIPVCYALTLSLQST